MSNLCILFQEDVFRPPELSGSLPTRTLPATSGLALPQLGQNAGPRTQQMRSTLNSSRTGPWTSRERGDRSLISMEQKHRPLISKEREEEITAKWINSPLAQTISGPFLPGIAAAAPLLPTLQADAASAKVAVRPVAWEQTSSIHLTAPGDHTPPGSKHSSKGFHFARTQSSKKTESNMHFGKRIEPKGNGGADRCNPQLSIEDSSQPQTKSGARGKSSLVAIDNMQQSVFISRGDYAESAREEQRLEEEEWNRRFQVACSRRKRWQESAANGRQRAHAYHSQQERSRVESASGNDAKEMQQFGTPRTIEEVRERTMQQRRKVRETAALATRMSIEYEQHRIGVTNTPRTRRGSQLDPFESTSSNPARAIIEQGRHAMSSTSSVPGSLSKPFEKVMSHQRGLESGHMRRPSMQVQFMPGGPGSGSTRLGKIPSGSKHRHVLGRWKKNLMCKVGHKQTLKERIKRLRKLRKEAAGECTTPEPFGKCVNGIEALSEEDKALLKDCFERYDADGSGELDTNELKEALNDLGLAPRSREEKIGLAQILMDVDREGDGEIDVEEFEELVGKVMSMLREASRQEFFDQFSSHDCDGSGSLDTGEINAILAELNLAPRTVEEKDTVEAIIFEVDSDQSGSIEFHEFEELMTRTREALGRMRRKRQRDIAEQFKLDDEFLEAFKLDLDELKDCFDHYDEDHSGHLDIKEVGMVVADCGLRAKTKNEREEIQECIRDCDADKDGSISFPEYLKLMIELRRLQKESKNSDLRELFGQFDSDGSGELSLAECSRMLEQMGLTPKTRSEQREIALLLDAVDADGSGELDFVEFSNLYMRVAEKLSALNRKEELETAKDLNISPALLEEYRQAFETLDQNGTGELGLDSVRRMMEILRINISGDALYELFCDVDEDESGLVEFPEFLKLMQLVEEWKCKNKPKCSIYAPHRMLSRKSV